MPKLTPNDFTVYEKLSNGKPTWSVLYRDAEGNRLSAISLPKLKKQLYTGKKRFEPIKDKAEAVLIAQKALNNPDLKDKLLNRKKPSSPNFIEYVNMVWDYKNSPYIKRRIKEKKPILEDTCKGNIKAFNDYVAPLISKKLTLKDIDKSKGGILTEIRDKVIDLDIHPTTKNKGFQAMRTAFYSIRKTAATLIASGKGIGAEKAAELLGHKDTYVTTKHYIRNTPESAIANFNDIRQLIKFLPEHLPV